MSRLSRLRLAAYALPALALAALGIPVHVHMPTYYAETVGLGLAATGGALLVSRLVDLLVDPIIGLACDGGHGRRRRGWLLAGLPLLLVAGWHLFMPPVDAGVGHLVVWSAAFYLGLTLMLVPYQAWGAELSSDYGERTRIASWREGFALVGVLLAVAGPAALSLPQSQTLSAFFPPAAAILIIGVAAAVFFVPECPPAPVTVRGPVASLSPLMRNRPFRRLVLAQALNATANALPATLFLIYVGDGLGRPDLAGPLLLAYFFAAIIGIPLWLVVAARMGKHPAWRLSLVLTAVAFVPAVFLGQGQWPIFAVVCLLTGLGLAADLALPAAILADVVDEHSAQGGGSRTGLYVALWSLTGKLALAVAVGCAFPLLALAGFKPGSINAPASLLTLGMLYAGAPIVLKLAAVAAMGRFPLDRTRQQDLRRRIAILSEA
jgi:GPH family glycoside/pentoside/hexuronide:cation symporter